MEWLLARVTWLSATEGAGESRSWHEAFRIGAVDAIMERLAAVDVIAGEVSPVALARVDGRRAMRAAAVEAFAAANLRLGPGRSIRVERRGFARGHIAGTALPLPNRRE